MKLSIIIPAHNEEKRITETLKSYLAYFNSISKNNKSFSYNISIVINNTSDKTSEIVAAFQKKDKHIFSLNFKQGGKGFAVIEGFKQALEDKRNDLIGFVDADMSTSPEEFFKLVENIRNYDGIIASRYIRGAYVMPKQTFTRIFVSRAFNLLIRIMFMIGYRDTQCGAKIFKRKRNRFFL